MGTAFWRIYVAYTITTVGDELYALALPLVLLSLGYRGSKVTFLFAMLMASTVMAGLLVGHVVDRHPPHSVITGSYLASAGVLGVGVTAIAMGADGYLVALLGAAALGLLEAVSAAAVDAGIPRTVARPAQVRRGYSLVESARTAASIFGPALAGAAASVRNVAFLLGLNAGSFLIAAATAARGSPSAAEVNQAEPAWREVWTGLRTVTHNAALRNGITLSLLVNFTLGAEQPLFLMRLVQDLAVSSVSTSLIVTSAGVISILAALLLGRLTPALPAGPVMVWSSVLTALTAVGIGLTRNVAIAAVLHCTLCAATISYNVSWRTYRQGIVSPGLLGRISATCRSLAYSGVFLGVTATGALQQAGASTSQLLVAGGVLCLVGMGVWPVFAYRTAPHARAGRNASGHRGRSATRLGVRP